MHNLAILILFLVTFTTIAVETEYGIRKIDIEKYLEGVVSAEIPEDWPMEVQKAQAVVSRSYIVYHLSKGKTKFSSTETDQVWKETANPRAKTSVSSTKGYILTFPDGSPAPGFFHSTCGGMTELPQYVWNITDMKIAQNFTSVKCSFCTDSPRYFWKKEFDVDKVKNSLFTQIDNIIALNHGKITDIEVSERTDSGRSKKVKVETESSEIEIEGTALRQTLGLYSTLFTVEKNDEKILFTGRGYGHGVGMCQWGAKTMADSGKNWREILKFYFPKLEVKKFY